MSALGSAVGIAMPAAVDWDTQRWRQHKAVLVDDDTVVAAVDLLDKAMQLAVETRRNREVVVAIADTTAD